MPITNQWDVQHWPQIYLLDREGVIRQRYEGEPRDKAAVDQEIDKLLAESQGAGPHKSGQGP
jgi:hypothetical protein